MSFGSLAQLDLGVLLWFAAHRSPPGTLLMSALSVAHLPGVLIALACAVAVYFWRMGQRAWVVAWLLAVPCGMGVNTTIKLLVHRARPVLDHPLLQLQSYSFPSGHVAGATLFYGMVCVLASSRVHSAAARCAIYAAGAFMVLAVAVSRMYLGAHFPTDVLAAFVVGTAWLAVAMELTRMRFGRDWHRRT